MEFFLASLWGLAAALEKWVCVYKDLLLEGCV